MSRAHLTTRPRRVARAAVVAVTAVVVALTGCAETGRPPAGGAPASSTVAASFNDADLTFVRTMIPHPQQAIAMADLLLAKDDIDAEVTALARQIKTGQQPEIDTTTGWLRIWGAGPVGSNQQGAGLLLRQQMLALERADGPRGRQLFLQGMLVHHRGGVAIAEDQITAGQNPDVTALA